MVDVCACQNGVHVGIFIRIIHNKAKMLNGLEFVHQHYLFHEHRTTIDSHGRRYDSLFTTISVLPISFQSPDPSFIRTTMNGSLVLR